MVIVIDAYNLLKQLNPGKEISERIRLQFIKQLTQYGKSKGHFLVIVFDGGQSPWVDRTRMDGALVMYAGSYETADDVIKRYLTDHRGHDLLLVSSDNDLRQHARRLSVESLDSLNFYSMLMHGGARDENDKKTVDEQLVKTTKRSSQDVDVLMHQASQMANEKTDNGDGARSRKSSGHTLSKEERALLKKIKKL